ncbi:MAG: hypothetical protein HS126_00135 [Anaerolineales bacterium]|nr:hypothetical protein [Anaerolineales bacterium]
MLHLRARWYSPGEGVFLSRDPVESEPPYQYVRGNPANWVDPSGLLPNYVIARELGFNSFDDVMAANCLLISATGPIGKIYDGELRPLFQEVIRSIDAGWRLEKNLFGNDRYQDGLVRFGRHFLAIAIPGTRPMPLGFNNPNDSNLIVVPSSYRTVIHFQGFIEYFGYRGEFAYRFNFASGNQKFWWSTSRHYERILAT